MSVTRENENRPPTEETKKIKEIGSYSVQRLLGQGGMGCVYLCKKKRTDSDERREASPTPRVAVKVLRSDLVTDNALLRFRRERVMLAAVDSQHVPSLLDAGTTADGRPYYVMEYIEGEPILEYVARENLSRPARLELFEKVCHAVSDVHDRLIIHRDIKPSNLFITKEDGQAHVVLLDFGLATLLDADGSSVDGTSLHGDARSTARSMLTLTQDGTAPHTPVYAAPEQRTGSEATTASDIYALGVLLCRLASEDEEPMPGSFPFCENILIGDDDVCCLHGICRLAAHEDVSERIATAEDLARAAREVHSRL